MSSLQQQPEAPDTPPVSAPVKKPRATKKRTAASEGEDSAFRPGIEWEEGGPKKTAKKPRKEEAATDGSPDENEKPRRRKKKSAMTGLNRAICKSAKTFRKDVERLFTADMLPPPPPTVEEDPVGSAWQSIVDWWNETRVFVAAVLGMLASDLPSQYLILHGATPLPAPGKTRGKHNSDAMRFIHRHVTIAMCKIEYWAE